VDSNRLPHCTIIVLNFNGVQLLPACLDSLAQQTGASIETVIIDNASTDGSKELVAHKYPWARFMTLEKNSGFSIANNVAVRDAIERGSDYVLLLNNDTFAAPDFVAQMLAIIDADPQIAVVSPKIFFAHAPDKLWYAGGDFSLWTSATGHRGWKRTDHGQFDQRQGVTQATGCAMLVRCSVIRNVGLLDEQFWIYAEDLDWSVRFVKAGYRIAFAPKARLWHLDGATNVKALGSGSQEVRQFLSTRNMIFVMRKHARCWQIPSLALGFIWHHIAFFTALRIWRRDFRALWAIYRGIWKGLTTPLTSENDTSLKLYQKLAREMAAIADGKAVRSNFTVTPQR
jgi:GT2 family glycosyltransferase